MPKTGEILRTGPNQAPTFRVVEGSNGEKVKIATDNYFVGDFDRYGVLPSFSSTPGYTGVNLDMKPTD